MGLIASGGVTLGGLEWLGARVYDPAARGFLSTDPLAPVTGAAWSGNPYSYAGNDPLHALDPLGLRPATDADLDAYAHANQGAFAAAGEWIGDNWEYLVAGGMIVAGGLMMASGVGGPIGLALISGGLDVGLQKLTTGEVNWAQAAGATVLGGVGGAAGSFANAVRVGGQATRVSTQVAPTARVVKSLAVNIGVNGGAGAAVGTATYAGTTVLSGQDVTLRGLAGAAGGGFVSGAVGGVAGPSGGSIAEKLGKDVTGITAKAATSLVGGAGGISGETVDHYISGDPMSFTDLAVSGVGGAALPHVPLGDRLTLTNAEVLRKVPYTQIQTVSGLMSGSRNAVALMGSAGTGAVVGGTYDSAFDTMLGD